MAVFYNTIKFKIYIFKKIARNFKTYIWFELDFGLLFYFPTPVFKT